jgi:hypothetical protein
MRWGDERRGRFCRKCVIGYFAHASVLCLAKFYYSDSQIQNNNVSKEEGWVERLSGSE